MLECLGRHEHFFDSSPRIIAFSYQYEDVTKIVFEQFPALSYE